jgi:hypothetical protein
MRNFRGIIIEESLENKEVLKKVGILSTKVEKVTDEHQTPWLSQWTLHAVEVSETEAQAVAEEISRSIDPAHAGSWYADFKNDTHHYVIFRDKVFYIDRKSREQYAEAERNGISLGLPAHQVDFRSWVEE